MSWDELRAEVRARPQALREAGVDRRRPGGRHPAQHARGHRQRAGGGRASARCGRPARPTSASQGVLDRFGQIEPKVLIACDGYYYNGKSDRHRRQAGRRSSAKLPTVRSGHRRALSRPRQGGGAGPQRQPDPQRRDGADLGATRCSARAGRAAAIRAACRSRIPSTCCSRRARPACPSASCIRAGGTLLKHLCEHRLHCDMQRGRPAVLFHDAGLDDVELAGLGSRLGRNPAALRRLAVPSRRQHAVGLRAGREGHAFRHVRQIHRRARRRPELAPAETHDLSSAARRRCRPARRWRPKASTTSTRRSSATCISPRSPAAPISAAASCSAFRPSRSGAARSRGRGSGMAVDVFDEDGKPVQGTARANSSAPSRSPPCRSASGTIPTARSTTPPISRASPTSGITATSPNGPSTAA